MFASESTTNASSDASAISRRIWSCRRLRAALGACDMNGDEPLLERGQLLDRAGLIDSLGGPGERPRQFADAVFEFRVVGGKHQRLPILIDGFGKRAAAMVDVCKRTEGGEISRRDLDDVLQFALRVFELIELDEGASEGHPRRQIIRVKR